MFLSDLVQSALVIYPTLHFSPAGLIGILAG